MARVLNTSRHVVSLTAGGLLAPGEARNIDASAAYEQRLVADGTLVVLDPNEAPPAPSTPPPPLGYWRQPVATDADLPNGVAPGEARVVLADSTAGGAITLRVWSGSAWVRTAGGGGGGGGGGGFAGNLFVSGTRPDAPDIDS